MTMPRSGIWLQVRRQLLGYKIDDKHIEQDAVMALCCVVAEARRTPVDGQAFVKFDAFAVGPTETKIPFNWRRPRVLNG